MKFKTELAYFMNDAKQILEAVKSSKFKVKY